MNTTHLTAAEHASIARNYFAQGKRVQAKFHGLAALARIDAHYPRSNRDEHRALSAAQILDLLGNAGI